MAPPATAIAASQIRSTMSATLVRRIRTRRVKERDSTLKSEWLTKSLWPRPAVGFRLLVLIFPPAVGSLPRCRPAPAGVTMEEGLEQLDIVDRRPHDRRRGTAIDDRQFLAGNVGSRVAVETLNECPAGMRLEHHPAGVGPSDVFAGKLVA